MKSKKDCNDQYEKDAQQFLSEQIDYMEDEINHPLDDLDSINQKLIDREKMEIEELKKRLNEFLLLPQGWDALEGFIKDFEASQEK